MATYFLMSGTATKIPLSDAQWRALVVVLAGDAIGKRPTAARSTSCVYGALTVTGNVAARLKALGLVRTHYEAISLVLIYRSIGPTNKLREALARNAQLLAEAQALESQLRAKAAAVHPRPNTDEVA